jgi:hypothetical protein
VNCGGDDWRGFGIGCGTAEDVEEGETNVVWPAEVLLPGCVVFGVVLNGDESLDVDGVVAGVDWRDEAVDGVLDGWI